MEKFNKEVRDITADRCSGSLHLLNHLLDACSDFAKRHGNETPPGTFRDLITLVAGAMPQFPVIGHFVKHFAHCFGEWNQLEDCRQFVNAYRRHWISKGKRLSEQAERLILPCGKTILAHSNSSTLHAFFKYAVEQGNAFKVLQTVSYPGEEGRLQAAFIAALGVETKLIKDREVPGAMPVVDVAICGADAFTDEEFYNKIGTENIATACADSQKPFFVLCDPRKRTVDRMRGNARFEWVNLNLVTAFISGD